MSDKFFDYRRFGRMLQRVRKIYGFENVESFCEAVEKKTGVSLKADTVKKLERGIGAPSFDKVLAMLSVFVKGYSIDQTADVLKEVLDESKSGSYALSIIEERLELYRKRFIKRKKEFDGIVLSDCSYSEFEFLDLEFDDIMQCARQDIEFIRESHYENDNDIKKASSLIKQLSELEIESWSLCQKCVYHMKSKA